MIALLLSGGEEFMEGIYRIALGVLIACALALVAVVSLYLRSRRKRKLAEVSEQVRDS
jgi:uncharacterized membrane protein YccC